MNMWCIGTQLKLPVDNLYRRSILTLIHYYILINITERDVWCQANLELNILKQKERKNHFLQSKGRDSIKCSNDKSTFV